MAQTNSRFFSVMVVGDNHKELMERYSMKLEVEPYVKYEYLKADKYLKHSIAALDKILSDADTIGIDASVVENLSNRISTLKKMTPFEYYRELTNGMYYDSEGNALSTENKEGHWTTARIGKNFSIPLKLFDGSETYSAKAKDIDWEAMKEPKELYEAAWEMVVDGREPKNENENKVYQSMKDKTAYFSKFKSKDEYVTYSTSFWYYAFVNEENGWMDMDHAKNEKTWIKDFSKTFVDKIQAEDTVTIYECTINNG